MPLEEYDPGAAFPCVIGWTADESSLAWLRPLRAAAGLRRTLFRTGKQRHLAVSACDLCRR
jgi:hypothetical protein